MRKSRKVAKVFEVILGGALILIGLYFLLGCLINGASYYMDIFRETSGLLKAIAFIQAYGVVSGWACILVGLYTIRPVRKWISKMLGKALNRIQK